MGKTNGQDTEQWEQEQYLTYEEQIKGFIITNNNKQIRKIRRMKKNNNDKEEGGEEEQAQNTNIHQKRIDARSIIKIK